MFRILHFLLLSKLNGYLVNLTILSLDLLSLANISILKGLIFKESVNIYNAVTWNFFLSIMPGNMLVISGGLRRNDCRIVWQSEVDVLRPTCYKGGGCFLSLLNDAIGLFLNLEQKKYFTNKSCLICKNFG